MKRTIKEYVEPKTFEEKALFDDFKDSIGGRCFNKDSVYRWVYKLTDIRPTDDEIYEIMDKWVKNKWAYKKENERTGANFYYFDLKETVSESKKNMKRITKESKRDYYRMAKNPIDIFNSKELNRFADKLVDKFGHITDYDKFVDESMKWLDFDLDESEMISAEALTELGYDEDDFDAGDGTYEEALYDFVDKVWDYMKDSYYVENKKIMKEEKELKLIDTVEVKTRGYLVGEITEIGYFGKGTWNEAKEFVRNNTEGWMLPTKEEAKKMIEKYYGQMKWLCKDKYFWFWTDVESRDKYAYIMNYEGDTASFGKNYDDCCIFCIR